MNIIISALTFALLTGGQYVQVPLEPITPNEKPLLSLDTIPSLGFGTWNLKEKNTSEAVSWAIQVGYRHIDAAAIYGNEDAVGAGIADGLLKTGLRREDLWITSKLWNDHHDVDSVESAINQTLARLRVSYLDLYHMHWPVANTASGRHRIDYRETWAAMAALVGQGKTRHVGVCNFSPAQLRDLLQHSAHAPAVHQMEMHPYLQQNAWLAWHRARGIRVTAYSPLAGTNPTYRDSSSSSDDKDSSEPVQLLNNTLVRKLAAKRKCSPAQVVLRWGLAREGVSVIPKSIHAARIVENFAAAACPLTPGDLRRVGQLAAVRKRYNNPSRGWGLQLYEGLEDADGKRGKANFSSAAAEE